MNNNPFSYDNLNSFNNSLFRKTVKNEFSLSSFTKKNFNTIIESLVTDIDKKNYHVSPYKEHYAIKDYKKNVTRRLIEFDLKDFYIYHYLLSLLQDDIAENRVTGTYGGYHFTGNSIKHKEQEEEKSLEVSDFFYSEYQTINRVAFQKYYGEFQTKIRDNIISGNYNYIAKVDIANFYDNISLGLLEEKLRNKISGKGNILSLLLYFLKYWDKNIYSYSPRLVGLPTDMGGEASRLLANFYLQEYDEYIFEKCKNYNITYLRYADDQVFFSKNTKDLKKIVFLASKRLAKLNLNINISKVFYQTTASYTKKNLSIDFSYDIQNMYEQLTNFPKECEKILFVRGLKRLFLLINKSEKKVTFIESNIIQKWIEKDNYFFLHQTNSNYELKRLKEISKKLNLNKSILKIITDFIPECFDSLIIERIQKIFDDENIEQCCEIRLQEIKNL